LSLTTLIVCRVGEDGIKLMEDYGNMSPDEMSILLFRSLGAFGAKGKCILILLVSLLFAFFLLIPSTKTAQRNAFQVAILLAKLLISLIN
jgi:hypothetical protein